MRHLLLFTIAASAGVLAVGTAVIQPAGALEPCGSIASVQQGKTFQQITRNCDFSLSTHRESNPDLDSPPLLVAQNLLPVAEVQSGPFGDLDSVAYAERLWETLSERNLVGEDPVRSFPPYPSQEPHGLVLEQVEGILTLGGREGVFIVKTNFMAEDITVEQVQEAEHGTYLDSWTVMFRREAGYAPDSGDWFWAKWKADGTFDTTPDGVPLAGRVQGCIDCHADAPGDDFVFSHDRYGRQ